MLCRFAEFFVNFLLMENRNYSVPIHHLAFFLQYFEFQPSCHFTHKSIYLTSMVFLFVYHTHSKSVVVSALSRSVLYGALQCLPILAQGFASPLTFHRSTLFFFFNLYIKVVLYYIYSSVTFFTQNFLKFIRVEVCS